MLSLPATFAWFMFLLAVLWIFQRITHWATQLNIYSLFLGFLVLRHGITVPFDHTVNQWYAGIDISPAGYHRFYLSLVTMWTSLLVGTWVGRSFLGQSGLNLPSFRKVMRARMLPAGINEAFVLILLISLGLVIYYNVRTDVSWRRLLTGDLTGDEYRAMRNSFGTATHYSAGIGFRLASIVRFGLLPTLVCTLYYLSKRSRLWGVLFVFTLLLGLFVGLISGQKGAALFLLVSLGIAMFYQSGRVRLRPTNWRVWSLAALGVCAVSFLYRVQYPRFTLGEAFRATIYRLTSEADRSLQLYFQIYPDVQPFLHGHSSSLINSILGVSIPVDQLPERFIPTYYLGADYLNTWNGAFIGVAWADFGYYGVVLESALVGFLLYAYARWFREAPKTCLVMGTQVGLMMASTRLSEVALSATLLTFGLLSSFFVYWFSRGHLRPTDSAERQSRKSYAHSSSRS
jgi:hypothetical protein